ncbi:MAG: pantoate--beta-alanine ligase [Proteobacteria bacterium]|nr:MAG: pantoate--beta-alanine ligase [Pseudomonadota bacterium]
MDLRAQTLEWRLKSEKIGFVPTMGALHAGHVSLIEAAKKKADRVVVSIFVNPLQFGPKEDFGSYPRMLAADIEKLDAAGVDALFAPIAADMYPEGFQTSLTNNAINNILDGRSRPGHFDGVLTVVSKLFNLVQPDFAFFGKKDYQQLAVITNMVRDLAFPLEIIGCPTARDPDGLAMSSRNLRLTPEERTLAPHIYKGLRLIADAHAAGEKDHAQLIDIFRAHLSQVKDFRLDYIEIRAQDRLMDFDKVVDRAAVALVAAHLGSVRLIDNLEFGAQ